MSKSKQTTLFQSWGSRKTESGSSVAMGNGRVGPRSSSTADNGSDVIDITEESDEDDMLLAMAMEESLKYVQPQQPSAKTSTSAYDIKRHDETKPSTSSFFSKPNQRNNKQRNPMPSTSSSSLYSAVRSNNQYLKESTNSSSVFSTTGCSDLATSKHQPEQISTDMFGTTELQDQELIDTPSVPESTKIEDLPGFDNEAGQIYIYPTNYPVRQYQYTIVQQALFNNTLVVLPTGLGKTFIAAVVMYNFYRWYPQGKIVFMAPTKPLVAQQIEACYHIMGIPQDDTAVMTGAMQPGERKKAWQIKRVFFLTPQVLMNDLTRCACQSEHLKCLVVDEAHKALGNHAYCQVVREIVKYSKQFRVLALSATPGSDIKAVQQVLTNLLISHVELKAEDSDDIRPYTHERKVEKIVVPLGEHLTRARDKYLQILNLVVMRLRRSGVIYNREAKSLSKFLVLKAREGFRQNPPENLQRSQYGAIEGDFALCMSLYHGFELLQLHGLRSLYNYLSGLMSGEKGYSRTRTELSRNTDFTELMQSLKDKYDPIKSVDPNASFTSSGISSQHGVAFVCGHPKLEKLQEVVVEHFQKYTDTEGADDKVKTRIMIFSQYRDSVNEITEMLNRHRPLVRVMSFIGQSSAGKATKGFTQKEQLKVMQKFREGGFNTLVSTCVGEEGLDIGDVDLIICFDAHKSPIRLVQRMGRTGRKREGRIVMLITQGKEEQVYNQSQYSKRSIHKAILNGARSLLYYADNPRLVPQGLNPVCHKMHISVHQQYQPHNKAKSPPARPAAVVKATRNVMGKKVLDDGFLTDEELKYWNDNYKVKESEIHTLAQSEFVTLKHPPAKQPNTRSERPLLSLNKWMPWQNRLQPTAAVSHSMKTRHLVELMEFIDIQSIVGDEDNYGQEMATYLNEDDIMKSDRRNRAQGIIKFCSTKSTKRSKTHKKHVIESDDSGPEVTESESRDATNLEAVRRLADSDEDLPVFALGAKQLASGGASLVEEISKKSEAPTKKRKSSENELLKATRCHQDGSDLMTKRKKTRNKKRNSSGRNSISVIEIIDDKDCDDFIEPVGLETDNYIKQGDKSVETDTSAVQMDSRDTSGPLDVTNCTGQPEGDNGAHNNGDENVPDIGRCADEKLYEEKNDSNKTVLDNHNKSQMRDSVAVDINISQLFPVYSPQKFSIDCDSPSVEFSADMPSNLHQSPSVQLLEAALSTAAKQKDGRISPTDVLSLIDQWESEKSDTSLVPSESKPTSENVVSKMSVPLGDIKISGVGCYGNTVDEYHANNSSRSEISDVPGAYRNKTNKDLYDKGLTHPSTDLPTKSPDTTKDSFIKINTLPGSSARTSDTLIISPRGRTDQQKSNELEIYNREYGKRPLFKSTKTSPETSSEGIKFSRLKRRSSNKLISTVNPNVINTSSIANAGNGNDTDTFKLNVKNVDKKSMCSENVVSDFDDDFDLFINPPNRCSKSPVDSDIHSEFISASELIDTTPKSNKLREVNKTLYSPVIPFNQMTKLGNTSTPVTVKQGSATAARNVNKLDYHDSHCTLEQDNECSIVSEIERKTAPVNGKTDKSFTDRTKLSRTTNVDINLSKPPLFSSVGGTATPVQAKSDKSHASEMFSSFFGDDEGDAFMAAFQTPHQPGSASGKSFEDHHTPQQPVTTPVKGSVDRKSVESVVKTNLETTQITFTQALACVYDSFNTTQNLSLLNNTSVSYNNGYGRTNQKTFSPLETTQTASKTTGKLVARTNSTSDNISDCKEDLTDESSKSASPVFSNDSLVAKGGILATSFSRNGFNLEASFSFRDDSKLSRADSSKSSSSALSSRSKTSLLHTENETRSSTDDSVADTNVLVTGTKSEIRDPTIRGIDHKPDDTAEGATSKTKDTSIDEPQFDLGFDFDDDDFEDDIIPPSPNATQPFSTLLPNSLDKTSLKNSLKISTPPVAVVAPMITPSPGNTRKQAVTTATTSHDENDEDPFEDDFDEGFDAFDLLTAGQNILQDKQDSSDDHDESLIQVRKKKPVVLNSPDSTPSPQHKRQDSSDDLDDSLIQVRKKKVAVLNSPDSPPSPQHKQRECRAETNEGLMFKTPTRPAPRRAAAGGKRPKALLSSDEDAISPLIRRPRKIRHIENDFADEDDDDDFQDPKSTSMRGTSHDDSPPAGWLNTKNNQNQQPFRVKEPKKRKRRPAFGFIQDEAALSDEDGDVSSDEADHSDLDHMDDSFINDATQLTQAPPRTVDMKAVYLRSVMSPINSGSAKYKLQYNQQRHLDVFSQRSPEYDASYMEDSFCVGDDSEEENLLHSDEECTMLNDIDEITPVKTRRTKRLATRNIKNDENIPKTRRRIRRIQESSSEEEISPKPNHNNTKMTPLGGSPFIVKRKKTIRTIDSDSESDHAVVIATSENRAAITDRLQVKKAEPSDSQNFMTQMPSLRTRCQNRLRTKSPVTELVRNRKSSIPDDTCRKPIRSAKPDGPCTSVCDEPTFSLGLEDFEEDSEDDSDLLANLDLDHFSSTVQNNSLTKTSAAIPSEKLLSNVEKLKHQTNLSINHYQSQNSKKQICDIVDHRQTVTSPSSQRLAFDSENCNVTNADRSSVLVDRATTNVCQSREDRLRISRLKQEEFKKRYAAMQQKQVDQSMSHSMNVDTTLDNSCRVAATSHTSTPSSGELVILVASKEINGAQDVVSTLRFKHKVKTVVCQVTSCDFIVSERMGVKRKTVSDFCSGSNKAKLVDQVRQLCDHFDRPCIIIETDRVKPGEKKVLKPLLKSKYVEAVIASLSQTNIKVLHSESQEDTAQLLADLCQQEERKNMAITAKITLSTPEEQVLKFYLSLPRVSYVAALNLLHGFPTVKHFITSSVITLQKRGHLSETRAQHLYNYLRQNFDRQMLASV